MPKGYSRNHIPNRIALWRERRCLTQTEMAARMYLPRTTLANWESGRNTPPPEARIMLSRVLRVPVDELFP